MMSPCGQTKREEETTFGWFSHLVFHIPFIPLSQALHSVFWVTCPLSTSWSLDEYATQHSVGWQWRGTVSVVAAR